MQNRYYDTVSIPAGNEMLPGELIIPANAHAIVVFAHGSGSSRLSSRNRRVAKYLREKQFGTLLFDLLTVEEDSNYVNRFNIALLTERLVGVTNWLHRLPEAESCAIGYFGASTGAAAALSAAAVLPYIQAVVSRGGRPDLAMQALPLVKAPTLLIAGSYDLEVISLNRKAFALLQCDKQLEIVEGATHLFEEYGKMEIVAALAEDWFTKHLEAAYAHHI